MCVLPVVAILNVNIKLLVRRNEKMQALYCRTPKLVCSRSRRRKSITSSGAVRLILKRSRCLQTQNDLLDKNCQLLHDAYIDAGAQNEQQQTKIERLEAKLDRIWYSLFRTDGDRTKHSWTSSKQVSWKPEGKGKTVGRSSLFLKD